MKFWPVLVLMLLAAAISGCKDPENDMALQPKYEPYRRAEMFPDRSSARPLIAGTIPRDPQNVPSRAWQAKQNTGEVMAVDLASSASIPFPIDRAVVMHGQESFNIYCAVCHGRLGNGMGMIVERGFPRPPSFHVPRLVQSPDSHYYDVISNGFGAMYSYNDRIPPAKRWEIVAYIRALQAGPQIAGPAFSDIDHKTLIAFGDRPATQPTEAHP